MRHWIYTLLILLISTTLLAQTPEGFTYQAVARDASGEILANQSVGMRISILQGGVSGTSVYSETHAETTNSFGLINLEIGTGTTSDSFSAIDWSLGNYFIKIEMDANGGTSYTEFGTSQLLSVPYALHSKTAENTFSGNYSDLSGTPTVPTKVSDLDNDSGFITDPADADSDPANEIQDISLVGAELSITDGSTVDLSGLSTGGSESDPQVGSNTLNYLSKWDGSSLVTSSIFDNGRIGIGNSDPSDILHITSTTTPNIRVDAPGNSGYYIGFNSAGYMAFSTVHSGTPYWDSMILMEGRMGIGTISPAATLDIAGNLNLRGSNQFGTALIAESSLPHTGPHESVLMLQNASDDPSSEANLQFASGSPAHGRATISATHDVAAGLYNGVLDLEIRNGNTSYIKALTIRSSGNVGIGNSDPLTKLDVAGVITGAGGNSDQWNEAFNWGNHADEGYLTSASAETDPVFGAHVSSGITSGAITEWNTAFGWGDHGVQGYILSESDPEVGTNALNYLSKWDGSALVSSSIYDNGYVGIGTINPNQLLHLKLDAGDPNIRVDAPGDNGYYIGFNGAGYMAFSTVHGGAPYWDSMILKEGQMGIGITTPGAKLDINVPGVGIQNILNFSTSSGGVADIASFRYDGDNAPNPLILDLDPQGDFPRSFTINGGKVGIGIDDPHALLNVFVPESNSHPGFQIDMPDYDTQSNHEIMTLTSEWSGDSQPRAPIMKIFDEEMAPVLEMYRGNYPHVTSLSPGALHFTGEGGYNLNLNWEEGFIYGSMAAGFDLTMNWIHPLLARRYTGTWEERINLTYDDATFNVPVTINNDLNVSGVVDANNQNIKNVAEPLDPEDAATKAYVDLLESRIASLENAIKGITHGLVLWNKLGSIEQTESSEVGPNGSIVGADFAFEGAAHDDGYIRTATGSNYVHFPQSILQNLREKGTVELWINPKEPNPVPFDYGTYALLGESLGVNSHVYIAWGDGVTGLGIYGHVNFDGSAIQTPFEVSQFEAAIGTPFHVAICWDVNGIDGSVNTVRVYRNGTIIGTSDTTWDHLSTAVNFDGFKLGISPDAQGYDKFIVDNIKVWDHAKTNFGDRFVE